MPSDPVKRAVYQAQIEKLEEKRERKQDSAPRTTASTTLQPPDPQLRIRCLSITRWSATGLEANKASVKEEQASKRREDRLYADLKAQELLDLPPDERMKQVLQMSPEEQRALSSSLKGQRGDDFMEGMNSKQKETLKALNNPQQVVDDELMQAKLLRAIYSERQLDEVMTDFWFNHFNVYLGKGADRYLAHQLRARCYPTARSRQVRGSAGRDCQESGHALLSRQLAERGPRLRRSARCSQKPYPRRRRGRFPSPPPRQAKANGKRKNGLNENYGRELMELHTLGVNGGYTQNDVTEVARVLTGWTIDQPAEGRRLQVRGAHARTWYEDRAGPQDQGARRKRRHGSAAPARASSVYRALHQHQARNPVCVR